MCLVSCGVAGIVQPTSEGYHGVIGPLAPSGKCWISVVGSLMLMREIQRGRRYERNFTFLTLGIVTWK